MSDPIAIGRGYQAHADQEIGGSCWDLPDKEEEYIEITRVDHISATHRWSSTIEEAETELDVELEADAEFGEFEADFEAAYNRTREDHAEEQILTLRIYIETVDTNFLEPPGLHPDRCYGTKESPMSVSDFLRNCGDHYVAGHDYGGYIVFVGTVSDLTEEERRHISGELDVDYAIGEGRMAAYADTLEKLEDKDFEFRAVSRGFHQILASLDPDPTKLVKPSDVLTEIQTARTDWNNDANNDVMPSDTSNYGVVISQDIRPYEPYTTVFKRCTGQEPDGGLQCYVDYMQSSLGHQNSYRRWQRVLTTALDNMGQYHWGDTTNQANANKQEFEEISALLEDCQAAISHHTTLCNDAGYNLDDPRKICDACRNGAPPYNCEPDATDSTKCAHDASVDRVQCTRDNLAGAVTDRPDAVQPKADIPASERNAFSRQIDQYERTVTVEDNDSRLCTFAGISGEMASTDEWAAVVQTANDDWLLDVHSSRTDENWQKLTGHMWCTRTSYFYDNTDSSWTAHPDVLAGTNNSSSTVPFEDASGNPVADKYATSLAGVRGNFAGGGEFAKVDRGASPMTLNANSQAGKLTAYGYAFGLDEPENGTISRGGREGLQKSVSTTSKPEQKVVKKQLIRTGEGICYMHEIGGEFDGKDEWAKVYKEDGYWVVGVQGLCTDEEGIDAFSDGPCIERKTINATAVCYAYDQTN